VLCYRRCRGDLLQGWILAAVASTLDTTLAAGSGTMDAANAMGTSSRKPVDAVGNVVDAVGTSSKRVRSGMICIFSNYRLRIIFFQYHASLVKYRFLRSYSVKSRIYIVFHEFYDHLTCLYLSLEDFGLTA
jgi:coenzyme F420-reducing hydrogenase delta subunit